MIIILEFWSCPQNSDNLAINIAASQRHPVNRGNFHEIGPCAGNQKDFHHFLPPILAISTFNAKIGNIFCRFIRAGSDSSR